MTEVSATALKKVRSLLQIADDLHRDKDYNITRLTMLKSLCSDQEATAKFALHIAKKTQQEMKASNRAGRSPSKTQQRYQRLVGSAVRRMTKHLKEGATETEASLDDSHSEIQGVQNQYQHQRWGPVRIIKSQELLVVETALECILPPWASSDLGYQLARRYAERYDSRYGTGLNPKSASMVEDIAEFWGRHSLVSWSELEKAADELSKDGREDRPQETGYARQLKKAVLR